MTDISCNGWRNAATWSVNLWFGDYWGELAYEGETITADFCRETVEESVYDLIGKDSTTSGFIWDMLDLNIVDWNALASHYEPMEGEQNA